MKTKKTVSKRIKITKSGKLLRRKPKQCHCKAKESGKQRRQRRGTLSISIIDTKKIGKYLH